MMRPRIVLQSTEAGRFGECGASVLRHVMGVCESAIEHVPIPLRPTVEQTALGRAGKEKDAMRKYVQVRPHI